MHGFLTLNVPFGRARVGEGVTRIESMASGNKLLWSSLKNGAYMLLVYGFNLQITP